MVRTITEVAVLLQAPMVPVLAVTTVVVDASVTDPSTDSKSSNFPLSAGYLLPTQQPVLLSYRDVVPEELAQEFETPWLHFFRSSRNFEGF